MLDFILVVVGVFGTLYLIVGILARIFRSFYFKNYRFNNDVENLLFDVFKKDFVKKFEVTTDGRVVVSANNFPYKPQSNIFFDYFIIPRSYELTLKNNVKADIDLYNFFANNAKEVQSLLSHYSEFDKLNMSKLTGYDKLFSKSRVIPDLKFIKKNFWHYREFLYIFINTRGKSAKRVVPYEALFCIDRNLDWRTAPKDFNEKTLNAIKLYLTDVLNIK